MLLLFQKLLSGNDFNDIVVERRVVALNPKAVNNVRGKNEYENWKLLSLSLSGIQYRVGQVEYQKTIGESIKNSLSCSTKCLFA